MLLFNLASVVVEVVALIAKWKLCLLSGPAPPVKVVAEKRKGKGAHADDGKQGKGKGADASDDEGGKGKGKGAHADDGGKGKGKDAEDEDEDEVAGLQWCQRHSNLIQKVSARMQTAMLADAPEKNRFWLCVHRWTSPLRSCRGKAA